MVSRCFSCSIFCSIFCSLFCCSRLIRSRCKVLRSAAGCPTGGPVTLSSSRTAAGSWACCSSSSPASLDPVGGLETVMHLSFPSPWLSWFRPSSSATCFTNLVFKFYLFCNRKNKAQHQSATQEQKHKIGYNKHLTLIMYNYKNKLC